MSNSVSPRVIYDVTGTLELVSPLHVGSGHDREITTVKGKEGDNDPPRVAAIVRDANHAPYIPGTTLKGLLRRLAESHNEVDAVELFGIVKDDGSGAPGRITVFGARRVGEGPNVTDAPFVAGAETELGSGVFVAARTRIDGSTGTAGDHKLFHQEMVAPKTRFELRLRIDVRAGVDLSGLSAEELQIQENHVGRATSPSRDAGADGGRILEKLLNVLHPLCDKDGQPVGKGQTDGFGRIRLDAKTVKVAGRALGRSGKFDSHAPASKWSPPVAKSDRNVFRLVCDGPFLVIDASKKPKAGQNPEGKLPHIIMPQSWSERLPMLLGSSLSGALRARARWLAMLQALREGKPEHEIRALDPEGYVWRATGDEPPTGEPDVRFDKMSAIQRLFGVTGFRARLAISRLRVPEATLWDVTSVKLDRFTGGPVDNALFKTRAFRGVTIEVALTVEDRPSRLSATARAADRKLFDDLIADIRVNGLVLGHGGNKGFGWFGYEELI